MTNRYHHGDLREALIEAALELVATRGVDGFSMREAARVAGVSSAAPYRHFEDNDALLKAAAARAGQLLSEAQREAAGMQSEPLLCFRAIGVRSVGFAVEHPEWFKLMNTPRYRDRTDPEIRGQLESNELAVERALAASVEGGGLAQGHDPRLIMLAVQATTYGLTRMVLDGHLDTDDLDRAQIEKVAETVLNLLGTGFLEKSLLARMV
jgi:AcrR family transcriptional regulator